MNKKLKSMYKEIINNRNLRENIPSFLKLMADKYYTSASVRLALHYFTFYEMYCDDKNLWDSQITGYFDRISKIITHIVKDSTGIDYKAYVKETDEIRNGIKAGMNCLACYTDIFEIYEYALNRVEYRFKEMEQLDDDEEIARRILRGIFDSDDNVMINEMIKEVIGQLPMRITRQKYFEYLKDGLSGLIGASQDSFETYMYMIRSSAILDYPEDSKDIFPYLWEKKSYLEKIDFKNISKEEYETAAEVKSDAITFIDIETTAYYSLMELVNELYTILVCAPYKGNEFPEEREFREAAFYIVGEINTAYIKNKQDEISQDVVEKFKTLEGYQEDTEFDLLRLEDALFHINEHHRDMVENITEENLFDSLLLSKDLISNSLFIDLNKDKTGEIISHDSFQKEINKLIDDLKDKFQNCDRMIMRAIMANTINKVPVFFNSHSEVMDYVLYSLSKCTDPAEKYACVEILNEIMDYKLT